MNQSLKKSLLFYAFFFYFPGVTHVLLQLTGDTASSGLRNTIYMSLLWLIPVLLFPERSKVISAMIGLLLWATSLVGFGYFLVYRHEFSQSVLFVVFESNAKESSEYLEQYFKWWIIAAVAGYSAFGYWLWRRLSPVFLAHRTRAMTTVSILVFLFAAPVVKDSLIQGFPAAKVVDRMQLRMEPAAPWNLIMGYVQYRKQLSNMQGLLDENRKLPPLASLNDRHAKAPRTVVLVLGESTNRQHMAIYGYHRSTTPGLNAIKDELTVFTNVVSARPYTIESLQQVLTFADQTNPDLYLSQPTLMNMMRQAGYKTFWITNQQTLTKRNTMLTNFSQQTDVQRYMNQSRSQNALELDSNVLQPFFEALDDPFPRKMIIVHLLGTHMKYDYRFSPEYAQFSDRAGLPASLSSQQVDVINSYDNAVLFNDAVVSSLIGSLRARSEGSLLVYLSDHGEDVYDTPPHAFLGRNEGKPTLAMYAVPFMIWTSPQWQGVAAPRLSDLSGRPYSTSHFLHTWADLMGLDFEGFDASKSLVHKNFKARPLLVGDPYKPKSRLIELAP